MREKFIIFPYGQYISGNVVYSSFLWCTLLRDWNWHLQEILLKCNSDFMKKSRFAATFMRS